MIASSASKTPGQQLFLLYSTGVGGTTYDGSKLSWGMIGDRQKAGWERAARLFAQGLGNEAFANTDLMPDDAIISTMRAMAQNQLELNVKAYASDWLAKGKSREWIYPVAASQEIGEFINSLWQPWWSKENTFDAANQRIELVDAWHFIMSELLIYFDGDVDTCAVSMAMAYEAAQSDIAVEETAGDALQNARMLQALLSTFNPGDDIETLGVHQFFMLAESIGFGLEALQALYLGKSVLNQFRKDNGYKEGKYTKKWDGKREDNYFLSVFVSEQATAPSKDDIRLFLQTTYNTMVVESRAASVGAA